MITQIYEVKTFEEAKKISGIGIDFIGILAGLTDEYPEVLNIKKAIGVLRGITGNAKKIVLPFTEKLEEMIVIARQTNPDILHIAVEPNVISPKDVNYIKTKLPNIKIMRTIPVVDESSIELAKTYDGIADYLLLDSRNKKTNQLGVTGKTHDWSISRKIVESVSIPVILAGGIGPDNVAEAILAVKPFGVDSKTKTDEIGGNRKDIEKVKEFLRIAESTKYVG